MSLEKILEKINEKEQAERDVLQAEHDEVLTKISKELKTEIDEYEILQKEVLNKKISFAKQKQETDINIDRSKQILKIKREVLSEVYVEFQERLKKMSQKDYETWLVREVAKLNTDDSGVLTIGTGFIEINKDFGLKCSVEFDKELNFGFFYKSGKTIVNNTFDSILNNIKTNKELEISKILFG